MQTTFRTAVRIASGESKTVDDTNNAATARVAVQVLDYNDLYLTLHFTDLSPITAGYDYKLLLNDELAVRVAEQRVVLAVEAGQLRNVALVQTVYLLLAGVRHPLHCKRPPHHHSDRGPVRQQTEQALQDAAPVKEDWGDANPLPDGELEFGQPAAAADLSQSRRHTPVTLSYFHTWL